MKGLALLIGKPKMKDDSEPDMSDPEEGDEGETDEEMLPSEDEVSDFRDLRHALKVGDESLGAQAMKNFIATCIKRQLSK